MADEKIITIKLNETEYKQAVEGVINTKLQINKLRDENKAMSKDYAANSVAIEENNVKLKNLTHSYNQQTKALIADNKEVKGAEGAYRKLELEFTVASLKAKDLAAAVALGDNSLAGAAKKASERANSLNDKLKEIDGDVGQHVRKVGNYTQGILDAVEALKKQNATLVEERLQLQSNQTGLDKSSKAYKELEIALENNQKALSANNDKIRENQKALETSNTQITKYENGTKSLRAELKEIVGELGRMKLAGQENSDEYRNLSIRGGELKDTLTDISTELKNTGSDTRGIDQVVGAFTALGAAAQVAEGAQALLGTESEAVQESIQKMVAIQSVMNGVQEIGNALQKESTFMMGVMAVKSKVLAGWKITLTTLEEIFGVTAATSMALATAGITVLISGIILLIANFNSIIASLKSFFGIADKFKDTKNYIDANTKALDGFTDATNRSIDRMKAMGKSEQEILNEKKKRFNAELRLNADTYNKIKKLGDDATDEQKEQLKKSYDFVKNAGNEKYKLETEQIALTRSLNQKAAEDAKKLEDEKDKKIITNSKNTTKAVKDELKQRIEDIKFYTQASIEEIEKLDIAIAKEFTKEQEGQYAQLATDVDKQFGKGKSIDVTAEQDAFAERKQNYANFLSDKLEIASGNIDAELSAQQDLLYFQMKQELAAAQLTKDQKEAIEDKYHKASVKLSMSALNEKLSIASSLANAVATIAGKETKLGKAAAATGIAINAIQGGVAAVTKGVEQLGPVAGAIVGGVEAAAIGVSAADAIKDVYATKEPDTNELSNSAKSTVSVSTKFHTGSMGDGTPNTKLKDDELQRTLQYGEIVLSQQSSNVFNSLLGSIKSMGGSSNITNNVGVNASGQAEMIASVVGQVMANQKAPVVVWKDKEDFETKMVQFKQNKEL